MNNARDIVYFAHRVMVDIAQAQPAKRDGWTFHMHPSTWITVTRDEQYVQYSTPTVTKKVADSSVGELIGIPVLTDVNIPRGMVEMRFTERTTLRMDGGES
jgi:hypothetical protein